MHSDVQLDATGLSCPLPLLKARQALASIGVGEVLYLKATDPGSAKDIATFCRLSGHPLLHAGQTGDGIFEFWLQKAAQPRK